MKKIQDLQINDILYSRYGYDTTIVNFYQVVKKTAKTITVREVKSEIVRYVNQAYAEVKARKNDFLNEETFRRKTTDLSNDYAIRLNDCEYLYVYDENKAITESNY